MEEDQPKQLGSLQKKVGHQFTQLDLLSMWEQHDWLSNPHSLDFSHVRSMGINKMRTSGTSVSSVAAGIWTVNVGYHFDNTSRQSSWNLTQQLIFQKELLLWQDVHSKLEVYLAYHALLCSQQSGTEEISNFSSLLCNGGQKEPWKSMGRGSEFASRWPKPNH